jgi:hypothetical protein
MGNALSIHYQPQRNAITKTRKNENTKEKTLRRQQRRAPAKVFLLLSWVP